MDPVVIAVARWGLGLLFASTALHKGRDLSAFREAVRGYAILPGRLAGFAAIALALAEATTAVLLFFAPIDARLGLWAAALLLTLYSGAIAFNLSRGRREIDCGCGGPSLRQPLGFGLIGRNLGLLVVALLALIAPRERSLGALDALTILGALAAGCGVYAAVQNLLATGPGLARLRVAR